MEPINIKEFKKLVKRYETITLEELKEIETKLKPEYKELGMRSVALQATGFGHCAECSLCKAVECFCHTCVYRSYFGCLNSRTYKAIKHSTTVEELLAAYRARAKWLREEYKQYFTE